MTTVSFTYSGAAQSWTVPAGVTSVIVELWGGASVYGDARGGYVKTRLTVTPGASLQVNVGGAGTDNSFGSGWNGGGVGSFSGAGATDVRSGGTALANRVAVAGGAGGGSNKPGLLGGAGGADTGGNGNGANGGRGGTQSAGGSGSAAGALGVGGDADATGGARTGGGGGGYYGGGGGLYVVGFGAGGGGSNYPPAADALASLRGVASPDGSTNGYASISYGDGISAAADSGNAPPRVALSFNAGDATSVTISRVDAAGNQTPVRLANPASLVDDLWVGYDYEAPYNQPVTYVATTDSGEQYTSRTVTVESAIGWLVHPGVPGLSIPLNLTGGRDDPYTIVSVGAKTRATNLGVHNVLGAADPVIISDGIRRSPTFDLTLRTNGQRAEDDLNSVLADTGVLLLQIVGNGVTRTMYQWVSIGDLTEAPFIDGYFAGDFETWTLPCTSTSWPAGLQQAEWSWADVVAGFATWTDVASTYASWQNLILNNPNATTFQSSLGLLPGDDLYPSDSLYPAG